MSSLELNTCDTEILVNSDEVELNNSRVESTVDSDVNANADVNSDTTVSNADATVVIPPLPPVPPISIPIPTIPTQPRPLLRQFLPPSTPTRGGRCGACGLALLTIVFIFATYNSGNSRSSYPSPTDSYPVNPEPFSPNLNILDYDGQDDGLQSLDDSEVIDFPPGAKKPPPNSDKLFVPTLKCKSEECLQVATELKSYMNMSVDPCDDFYQYSCGGWIQTHKVKKEDNDTNVFSELNTSNELIIRDVLVSMDGTETGAIKKAKDFYSSCINRPASADKFLDSLSKHIQAGQSSNSTVNTIVNLLKQKDAKADSLKCISWTCELFPEVVAYLFVNHTYTLTKQGYISTIVQEIKTSYKSKISHLSWMDQGTLDYLAEQFDTLPVLLGYPKVVMDLDKVDLEYANVSVSRNGSSYLSNLVTLVLLNRTTNGTTDSVDKILANQIKFTIEANAFYATWKNELFVPAGISMKPFFDTGYPKIINYAKFATVVGHEASHAFETYVRGQNLLGFYLKSDQVSTKSFNNFGKCSKCIEHQYDTFLIGVAKNDSLKGNVTFDENFADIAGLQVAFEAYLKFQRDFKLLPGLEEMSQEQLFFIAAAQTQCISFASEEDEETAIEVEIAKDEHSPNSARVLGEMMNFDEFAKAFNCPEGSRYNPVNKCRVFV